MERKLKRKTDQWDLPVTRDWMGKAKLNNAVVKREFIRQLNNNVQLGYLYLHEYYTIHGPIDIAYDAALKFCNDYSLLVLAKYLYDVDGKLVFSCNRTMNYFFKKVEPVAESLYNDLCRRFAILYGLYFSSLFISALFVMYFTYQYI